METSAHIDWISVTHKKHGNYLPEGIPTTHKATNGHNGYTQAREYTSGVLEMLNPERYDMGIHFIYSGKVLDNLERNHGITRDDILRIHTTTQGRLSRIDFAVDIIDSGFSIDTVWDMLENECVDTLASHSRIQKGKDRGYTVTVGSTKKRKKLVRIYDKAKEQKDWTQDFKRVELSLYGKSAVNGAKLYQDDNYSTDIVTGMIRKFCDFPEYPLWTEIFSGTPTKIPVGTHLEGQTETWLKTSVAPALARVLTDNPEFIHKFWEIVSHEMYKLDNELND